MPLVPQKIARMDYDSAYKTVLANPNKLTQERAAGLDKMVTNFLKPDFPEVDRK